MKKNDGQYVPNLKKIIYGQIQAVQETTKKFRREKIFKEAS